MDTSNPGNRPAANAAPAGPAKEPFSMQTVLVAARCWWKIATPLGLLLAVAAGAAVFYFTQPTYTAQAWIQINPIRETMFESVFKENPLKFVATQLEIMRSPPIVDSVASNPDVVSTPEIARAPNPAQAIVKLVKIYARSNSDLFVIEFTSIDPQKAALVANAVFDSFLSFQGKEASKRSSELIKLYEGQLTHQKAHVESLRDNWRKEAMTSSGIDPFAPKPTEQVVQVHNPHAALQEQLLRVQMEQLNLTVQIQYEEQAAKQPAREPSAWEIEQLVQNHPDYLKQKALADSLKAKADEYRERAANPTKNPTVQRNEADLKAAQDKLAALEGELGPKLKTEQIKAETAKRAGILAQVRQDLEGYQLIEKVIQEKLTGQIANQKQFREKSFDEELKRTEYETQYELLESIKAKIDLMRLEQENDSRVREFQRASVPKYPDGEAIPYKKIGMAGFAAFLLPFALTVVIEFLYRRVSSRDQIEFGGKIPVVGEVTALPRRMRRSAGGDDKPDRDLQLFEESIDGLRTYLSLVHSLQGMRVLAVTSSVSREGKTSLAAQLAVSIASSTGEATLLIDGDFRSPDVHQIFGIDRGPGMVEVLRNEVTLDEAIDTSFSSKLHLLTAGTLETSPHRLLGNGEFALLIDQLRSKYRHIVIDTPPILAASEALVMARTADAAILCVRRDFSRVGQVQEAYSRLQGTGVKTAGAVLNGIPSRQYATRYGSYYYSRSYGDKLTVTPQSSTPQSSAPQSSGV